MVILNGLQAALIDDSAAVKTRGSEPHGKNISQQS